MKFKILNPQKWSEATYTRKYQSTHPPPYSMCPKFISNKYFENSKFEFSSFTVYLRISDVL